VTGQGKGIQRKRENLPFVFLALGKTTEKKQQKNPNQETIRHFFFRF
jgi:hypothetical protein